MVSGEAIDRQRAVDDAVSGGIGSGGRVSNKERATPGGTPTLYRICGGVWGSTIPAAVAVLTPSPGTNDRAHVNEGDGE